MCCEDFEAKNYIFIFFIPVCLSIAAFILIVILSFKYVEYDFDKDNVISDISNNLNERLIYSCYIHYILSCIIVDCYNKIISNLNNKGNDIYIDALIDKILENHSSTYDFSKYIVIIMSFIPIAILVFLCLNYFCCLR